MDRVVRRYVVTGVVQGVGFRWFVREQARALGISGWVRNEADGSVMAVASSPPERLAAFEAQLRRGPESSRVENVEVTDVAPEHVDSPKVRGEDHATYAVAFRVVR